MTGARPTDWSQVPVVIDVPTAGRLLGLGKNTVYAAVQSGEIPSLRIGRRVLIARDVLRSLLERTSETQP